MKIENKIEDEKISELKNLLCPKACVLNQLDDDRLALFSLWNPILSFSSQIDSRSHLQHHLF
jgi:hypothetical protein